MSQGNVDVVRRYVEAFNRADVEACVELSHPRRKLTSPVPLVHTPASIAVPKRSGDCWRVTSRRGNICGGSRDVLLSRRKDASSCRFTLPGAGKEAGSKWTLKPLQSGRYVAGRSCGCSFSQPSMKPSKPWGCMGVGPSRHLSAPESVVRSDVGVAFQDAGAINRPIEVSREDAESSGPASAVWWRARSIPYSVSALTAGTSDCG
jgi:hypothetical protein